MQHTFNKRRAFPGRWSQELSSHIKVNEIRQRRLKWRQFKKVAWSVLLDCTVAWGWLFSNMITNSTCVGRRMPFSTGSTRLTRNAWQPSRYQMGQVLLGRGGLGQGADPVRNHPRRWSPSSWDTPPPCGPDTARRCRSWRWPLTFYNLSFFWQCSNVIISPFSDKCSLPSLSLSISLPCSGFLLLGCLFLLIC